MSSYEEKYGNARLTIDTAGSGDRIYISAQPTNVPLNGMWIPSADVPAVAAELLKAAGQEGVFVAKSAEEVRAVDGLKIHEEPSLSCGSGPEEAWATASENPNWLYNKAANCIALAEYIESKAQRETDAAKKLQERRDALVAELTCRESSTAIRYTEARASLQKAVDRIIELEDGQADA